MYHILRLALSAGIPFCNSHQRCLEKITAAQEFLRLSKAMMENRATEPGPSPPDMIDQQWSFLTPVVLDTVPSGACLPHREA